MSDSDKTADFKIERLKGPENFDSWHLDLASLLVSKSVNKYINIGPPTPTTSPNNALEVHKNQLAWSIIVQSLSTEVKSALSPEARDFEAANTMLLYQELRKTYAASTGVRRQRLFKEMYRTNISDNEDPTIALSKIRLAHTQLCSGGERLSQDALAQAMLMALPFSYDSMRQTLLVKTELTGEIILSAVRNEWASRQERLSMHSEAFMTHSGPKHRSNNKPMVYCSEDDIYGSHDTKDCFKLRRNNNNNRWNNTYNNNNTNNNTYNNNNTDNNTALRRSHRPRPQQPPRYWDDATDSSERSESPDPLDILAEVHTTTSSTPATFRDAQLSSEWEHWELAIQQELANMVKYNVWTVIPRFQAPKRVLSAKWVFTRKINGTTGLPDKFKARWVARGFQQVAGLDYNELFASVAHKDSLRVFLAVVNALNLECDQVDIKAAFLNGELEEDIYLEAPEGSNIDKRHVLRLNKSLYGLKQAPRCFNKKIDFWLRQQHFQPTHGDPCIYVRSTDHYTIISMHVDDQLIACNSRTALNSFKQQLNAQFECSDGGPVNYFLGFSIQRNRDSRQLFIGQQHYTTTLLANFNMTDCNPTATPLPQGFEGLKATDEEFQLAQQLPYPKLAGSLLYLATISRPDIAHAASMLCRFISKWSNTHFSAAKHLLRYLKGTINFGLKFDFNNTSTAQFFGYSDADWSGDRNTRRSTTGYVFNVLGGPVAWKSRLQPTVALSTTEAEYMATTDATAHALWLQTLLSDLKLPPQLNLQVRPVTIFNDNRGAIALASNPVQHSRTKHIDTKHHFIRDYIEKGAIQVQHVTSANNLADILTKYLSRDLYQRLRHSLNVTASLERVGVSD